MSTAGANDAQAPLDGLRVIDFTRVLAGPLSTMILGDLGADVVKIERPEGGDDTRGWGPPFVGRDAAYFLAVNRNKRSAAFDLKDPKDLSAVRRLVARADVLVENFRPGTMAGFGLDYETVARRNSRLVYCSIAAFPRGPLQNDVGYDLIVQAASGLMSMTGQAEDRPTKAGVAILDVVAGLYAAVGILSAVHERARTATGQHVSISLFETGVAALVNQAANYLLGGIVPKPLGNEHPNIVPYQVFECADGPLAVAAGNDHLFRSLCDALRRPDLAADARFLSNEGRVRNRTALIPQLADTLARRSTAHWARVLTDAGVPCARVRTRPGSG